MGFAADKGKGKRNVVGQGTRYRAGKVPVFAFCSSRFCRFTVGIGNEKHLHSVAVGLGHHIQREGDGIGRQVRRLHRGFAYAGNTVLRLFLRHNDGAVIAQLMLYSIELVLQRLIAALQMAQTHKQKNEYRRHHRRGCIEPKAGFPAYLWAIPCGDLLGHVQLCFI